MFGVARVDKAKGKIFIPISSVENREAAGDDAKGETEPGWVMKAWPAPFPLYKLDRIFQDPGAEYAITLASALKALGCEVFIIDGKSLCRIDPKGGEPRKPIAKWDAADAVPEWRFRAEGQSGKSVHVRLSSRASLRAARSGNIVKRPLEALSFVR